jgi:hypothetical protein
VLSMTVETTVSLSKQSGEAKEDRNWNSRGLNFQSPLAAGFRDRRIVKSKPDSNVQPCVALQNGLPCVVVPVPFSDA